MVCIDLSQADTSAPKAASADPVAADRPSLLVGTKKDLVAHSSFEHQISMHEEESITNLTLAIEERLSNASKGFRSEAVHHTLLRCRQALTEAGVSLQLAMEHNCQKLGEEIVAADFFVFFLAVDFLVFLGIKRFLYSSSNRGNLSAQSSKLPHPVNVALQRGSAALERRFQCSVFSVQDQFPPPRSQTPSPPPRSQTPFGNALIRETPFHFAPSRLNTEH